MIPISRMRHYSRLQVASDRGFNPNDLVEEELKKLEERAELLTNEVLAKKQKLEEFLYGRLEALTRQIENTVPDEELDELAARIDQLKGEIQTAEALTVQAEQKLETLATLCKGLAVELNQLTQFYQALLQEDPLFDTIREGGNRASRRAAGQNPTGIGKESSRRFPGYGMKV